MQVVCASGMCKKWHEKERKKEEEGKKRNDAGTSVLMVKKRGLVFLLPLSKIHCVKAGSAKLIPPSVKQAQRSQPNLSQHTILRLRRVFQLVGPSPFLVAEHRQHG